jgi:hypothetical protein
MGASLGRGLRVGTTILSLMVFLRGGRRTGRGTTDEGRRRKRKRNHG